MPSGRLVLHGVLGGIDDHRDHLDDSAALLADEEVSGAVVKARSVNGQRKKTGESKKHPSFFKFVIHDDP